MRPKHSDPILPLTKSIIFFLVFFLVCCICLVLYGLRVIPEVWPSIIMGILAIVGVAGTIIQIFQRHADFHKAMDQLLDIFQSIRESFFKLAKKLYYLPRWIWIVLCIFVLLISQLYSVIWSLIHVNTQKQELIFLQDTSDGPIGISDGRYVFDVLTRRNQGIGEHRNGEFKSQAASAFGQPQAASLWTKAMRSDDSDDAEALIYQEDLRVTESGRSYITLIVVTQLTGSHQEYLIGRADLQGAYVAQKEFNIQTNSFLIRLLIANIGDQDQYAQMVADRIRNSPKTDNTIKGVVGWPKRTNGIDRAIQTICEAKIPLVTISANDIVDQRYCHYNFSVAPSNKAQVTTSVNYIKKVLNKKRASVFYDPSDDYSRSLHDHFVALFPNKSSDHTIVNVEPYTVHNQDSLPGLIRATLRGEPDLIFFAAQSSSDLNAVLQALPDSGDIAVMGANAIYQNQRELQIDQRNLYFTAFAYPDEWSLLYQPRPAFVQKYSDAFDPQKLHPGVYGYSRANDSSMLTYDAIKTFMTSITSITDNPNLESSELTVEQLQKALLSNTYGGVTGLIQFSNQGIVEGKPVVIIQFDSQSHNQIKGIEGCYRVDVCEERYFP